MSLNGLDSHAVLQAHRAALALPEGWFLLSYISRDEVGILDQGAAGWEEARSSLSQYAEPSPLYGFLHYRGSKVILKYVPNGTSRLLKARTAVHYQTLADRFEHDASFEATSCEELTSQTLSAACSLLELETTAPSPPDVPPRAPGRRRGNTARMSQSGAEETTGGDAVDGYTPMLGDQSMMSTSEAIKLDKVSMQLAADTNATVPYVPDISHTAASSPKSLRGEVGAIGESMLEQDQFKSKDSVSGEVHSMLDAEQGRRPSTSASSKSEIWKSSLYNWKPKPKLFPRPVTEDKTNKSRGPGTVRQRLPIGMKSKKGDEEPSKRPRSSKYLQPDVSTLLGQQPHSSAIKETDLGPTLPGSSSTSKTLTNDTGAHEHRSGFRSEERQYTPSTYAVSVTTTPATEQRIAHKSHGILSSDSPAHQSSEHPKRSNVISPERQRLMKALQMRNTQRLDTLETRSVSLQPTESAKQDEDHLHIPESKTDSSVELNVGEDSQTEHVRSEDDVNKNGAMLTGSEKNEQPGSEPDTQHANSIGAEVVGAKKTELSQGHSNQKASHAGGLRTNITADDSSTISDDSLAHELESATVEEATPVSVARSISQTSPEMAPFSGTAVDQRTNPRCVTPILIRPASRGNTISRKSSGTPEAALQLTQHTPPSKSEAVRPSFLKKSNVSSGISRRIQALAEISSRESSPSNSPMYGNTPEASSFLGFRKPSSPDSMSRTSSHQRPSQTDSRGSSLFSAAARSRTKIEPAEATYKISQENQTSDTVSITARIVRGPSDKDLDSHGQAVGPKSQLYRSPLIIEHQPAETKRPASRSSALRDERLSIDPTRPMSRESSLTAFTRQSVETSWRLAGRAKSETISPPPPPKSSRSMSNTSLDPVSEVTETKRDSKESITSRMLKRMSGLSNGSKKRVESSDTTTVPHVTQKNSLRGVVVGDLNVQLPDTLLWKWRWVEIDAFGNIVVRSSRSNERAKSVPRKYHLSELRSPVIPTLDRQELAHSVILEFINGGTLQFACEDSIAQAQVFKRLLDTHHAWTSMER